MESLDPKHVNFTPPLDTKAFRENAIKRLKAGLQEKSELLEQMRRDVSEVRANYKGGDLQPLERVVTAVLSPLERDVKEIGEELKKYQDLQDSAKG